MKNINIKTIGAIGVLMLIIGGATVYSFQANNSDDEDNERNKNSQYTPYEYTEEDHEILEIQNSIPVTFGHSSYYSYDDIDELSKRADVVFIGRPEQHFLEAKHIVKYDTGIDGKEYLKEFHSITNVKVEEVLSGNDLVKKGDSIQVGQGLVLLNSESKDKNKSILNSADETFLQKGYYYVFFGVKLDEDGGTVYILPAGSQGQFNIDGRDTEEAKVKLKDTKLGRLRQQALKKYEKEIKSLGIPIVWEVETDDVDTAQTDNS